MARSAQQSQDSLKPWQQMVASSTGAVLTSIFVTPLDVVKIRLQAQQKPIVKGQCIMCFDGHLDICIYCGNGNGATPWYKRPGHFKGTTDAFVKIVRNEGVKTLWSGLPPALVMSVPATVVYFTAYDQLKHFLGYRCSGGSQSGWWIPSVAGIISRVGAVTVVNPLELVRTKMQSKPLTYRQLSQAVGNSVRSNGLLSLWRGWGPTVLRDVPFSAIYWTCYEYFKSQICSLRGAHCEPTLATSFVSGGAAGSIAGILTLPFDVVKTHRQIELGEMVMQDDSKKHPTATYQIMRNIIKERGWTGLFAGLTPRIIKVAPACAIMISTYEYGKSFFRVQNGSQCKDWL